MTLFSQNRLGARIIIAMGAALCVSSLLFLALFAPLYDRALTQEREQVASKLSGVLQIALQNAMLKRDLDGLRAMINDIGRSPNVARVIVLNPQGEARFSSDAALLGTRYDLDALCRGCASFGESGARAGFLRDDTDHDVMRSLRPVANQPPCLPCHGAAAEHPINGYLMVDYGAGDLRRQAFGAAGAAALAGIVVVATGLAVAWLLVQRLVVAPVGVLAGAARAFAQMDFSARDALQLAKSRPDEVGALAQGFDDMAGRLDAALSDMRAREAFQQSLIDAIPDGVRVIAEDYAVIAVNAEFCRQAGMTRAEILARPCYASSHGRNEPCIPTLIVCPLVETKRRAGFVRCNHAHVNGATKEAFAVEVVAAPLAAAGPKRQIVEAIRDLSAVVQVSQEQRLSELGQIAAGVAHEIHNPLASIRLGLHAISRKLEQHDEETRDFLNAVNIEVDRCLDTTERLTRLGRIPEERGALVDVGSILRDAIALLSYEAELRKVKVDLTVQGDARVVAADGDLGMIALNLMQNALHAMPEGGALSVAALATDAGDVELTVRDTGRGIDPEHLPKIFYPFWSWRADGSQGSGLGLAICQALVAKWGGVIKVHNRPGEGAEFTATFPHADKWMDRP